MKRALLALSILAGGVVPMSSQAPVNRDFNGTWKLQTDGPGQVYSIQHDESSIRIVLRIDDSRYPTGKRTFEVTGTIDGKARHMKALGRDCTFTAQWFGESLIWEVRRETEQGVLDYRRIMTLSGPDSIHAVQTRLAPAPEMSVDETWKRVSGAKV